MGRPKVPLINRDDAIAKALEIIDAEGIDAFSIRRLGKELGVNGASLYHHFKDKDEILAGVRVTVLAEAGVLFPESKTATWIDYVTKSVLRYRSALLKHPNTAPLMVPVRVDPSNQVPRDHMVKKMIEAGVPLRLAIPIIDSVETLAYGSAFVNPKQLQPNQRFVPLPSDKLPSLKKAVQSAPRSPEASFRLELEALLSGWMSIIAREQAG